MKIKILKTTVANNGFVRAGEIIEVSESDAKLLIGINKAEAVGEDAPAIEAIDEVLTTETAEAVVETKLKRGRKK